MVHYALMLCFYLSVCSSVAYFPNAVVVRLFLMQFGVRLSWISRIVSDTLVFFVRTE